MENLHFSCFFQLNILTGQFYHCVYKRYRCKEILYSFRKHSLLTRVCVNCISFLTLSCPLWSLPFPTDCFLSTQQHHGPGAVLCHLLQVSFSWLYSVYCVRCRASCCSRRALLLGDSVPRGSFHDWAITWTHWVTVGGSGLGQDT